MEKNLQNVLNEIILVPKTTGALVINNQGLCISNQGKISTNSSGIMLAILEQASKLEPNANPPIISLEFGKKKCLINKHGAFTGVLYKDDSLVIPGPAIIPATGNNNTNNNNNNNTNTTAGGGGVGIIGGIPPSTTQTTTIQNNNPSSVSNNNNNNNNNQMTR